MARYTCQRCKVECNTTVDHLCADLVKRLARQTEDIRVVENVITINACGSAHDLAIDLPAVRQITFEDLWAEYHVWAPQRRAAVNA